MKNAKKIFFWIVSVLFLLLSLGSLPNVAGFIGLLVVALLLPIDKWQNFLQRAIKNKIKNILAVVLAVATIIALPAVDSPEPQKSEKANSSVTTASFVADATTTISATTTQAPTTAKTTKETATTTKLTTTTTKATTTTTKLTTTTTKATTTTTKLTTTTEKPTTTKVTTITTKSKTTITEQEMTYVLNTKTKKFHSIRCSWLPDENREDTKMSRKEIIELGYVPCKRCNP